MVYSKYFQLTLLVRLLEMATYDQNMWICKRFYLYIQIRYNGWNFSFYALIKI
jgi:hypothetical protein